MNDFETKDALDAIDRRTAIAMQAHRIPAHTRYAGDAAGAYQLRIVQSLQQHTTLRDRDYSHLRGGPELDRIENLVVREALASANAAPDLREVRFKDRTGRVVSEFYGSPGSWMEPMKGKAFSSPIYIGGEARSIPIIG